MRIFYLVILSLIFVLPNNLFGQDDMALPLEERISLYPNPIADGILKVDITDDSEGTLIIYDFLGNEVFDVKLDMPMVHKYKFFLSDLSSGNYFVRIHIGNEIVTRKISVL